MARALVFETAFAVMNLVRLAKGDAPLGLDALGLGAGRGRTLTTELIYSALVHAPQARAKSQLRNRLTTTTGPRLFT